VAVENLDALAVGAHDDAEVGHIDGEKSHLKRVARTRR
jgi:hypothetical protein